MQVVDVAGEFTATVGATGWDGPKWQAESLVHCRPALCEAGLFHSVYGTEHYLPAALPAEMRAEVSELIGEEAEGLAWLFCVMERETFDRNLGRTDGLCIRERRTGEWLPLTPGQFADLVTLSFANTLEAMPRLPWAVRRSCRTYLAGLRGAAPRRRGTPSTNAGARGGNSGGEWSPTVLIGTSISAPVRLVQQEPR